MKTLKTLSLGLLLTVLAAACVVLGVLLFQNMSDAEDLRMEISKIQNEIGITDASNTEAELIAPEPERCEGGELRYYSVYTPLSFCYQTKLGAVSEEETGVAAEARRGTMYRFRFDRDEHLRLDLQSANFALTGDRDVPNTVSFSCIDFTKSNNELMDCFFDDVVSMERIGINDTKTLLVTLSIGSLENPSQTIEETKLIVPDILQTPKMDAIVTFDPEQEAEVRKILESVGA